MSSAPPPRRTLWRANCPDSRDLWGVNHPAGPCGTSHMCQIFSGKVVGVAAQAVFFVRLFFCFFFPVQLFFNWNLNPRGNKKEQSAHILRVLSETLSGFLAEGLQLLIRAAGGGAGRELFAAAFLCRVAAVGGFTPSQIFQLESLGVKMCHINTLFGINGPLSVSEALYFLSAHTINCIYKSKTQLSCMLIAFVFQSTGAHALHYLPYKQINTSKDRRSDTVEHTQVCSHNGGDKNGS